MPTGDGQSPFRAVATFDVDDAALWRRWEALRAVGAATPFQSAAFQRPLLTDLAPAFGRRPFVVEIFDADGTHVLSVGLVLGRSRIATHVEFPGFGITDQNAPVWRRDLDPAAGEALRAALLAALPRHDALLLAKMPERIDGLANPLAGWPGTSAMNVVTMVYDPASRPPAELPAVKEAARKCRKLRREGGDIRRVDDLDRAFALLDFAFALRADKAGRAGRRETIDLPQVQAFYRAVLSAGHGDGSVPVWEVVLGDRTIAMALGLAGGGRFNGTLMATDDDVDLAPYSPGMIAVATILEDHVAAGGGLFDLGPGEQPYKRRFGGEPAGLVEYDRVASPLGLPGAADRGLRRLVRRFLRRHPGLKARLQPLIDRLRRPG